MSAESDDWKREMTRRELRRAVERRERDRREAYRLMTERLARDWQPPKDEGLQPTLQ